MAQFVSQIFMQFLSTQCRCIDRKRIVAPSLRRRRRKDGILHRFQRMDLLVVVLFLTATSGDALLFKRGRGGHSGWSKGKNLGRDKVSSFGSHFESWVTSLVIENFLFIIRVADATRERFLILNMRSSPESVTSCPYKIKSHRCSHLIHCYHTKR